MSTLRVAVAVALVGALAACGPPESAPRTVFDFTEDGLAREGVLARCNQDRAATADDIECVNARRAAAVVALEQEHSRAPELERESERKLLALREGVARETEATERATAEARAAAEAAYEAQWRNPAGPRAGAPSVDAGAAPTFGSPVGTVLPSMRESLFDVPSGSPLAPPSVTVEPMAPPPNPIEIVAPELTTEQPPALIPRPFRADE